MSRPLSIAKNEIENSTLSICPIFDPRKMWIVLIIELPNHCFRREFKILLFAVCDSDSI